MGLHKGKPLEKEAADIVAWAWRALYAAAVKAHSDEKQMDYRMVGVVMECTITRQYTFIMAPNTVQELWITMPGRYTHAIHVFTPPRDYIHTS